MHAGLHRRASQGLRVGESPLLYEMPRDPRSGRISAISASALPRCVVCFNEDDTRLGTGVAPPVLIPLGEWLVVRKMAESAGGPPSKASHAAENRREVVRAAS